ncbi:MAG: hypothetical protein JO044_00200 [Mycobacteriaceae bacterium]|nr:hypothetical protein [Mycobacteriaceae bacterium]
MSQSAAAVHTVPAGIITHTIVSIRGNQDADLTVYHARTPDVRVAMIWGDVMMTLYTADAIQGILEGFVAARAAMAQVPREIPAPAAEVEPCARPALCIDWTRRPAYAVVSQTAPSKRGGKTVHWVDLHMGPLTYQIRDQIGLLSALDLLTRAHRTAIAVCLDGDQHSADPTSDDYRWPA